MISFIEWWLDSSIGLYQLLNHDLTHDWNWMNEKVQIMSQINEYWLLNGQIYESNYMNALN
jgi:hypothetical protein